MQFPFTIRQLMSFARTHICVLSYYDRCVNVFPLAISLVGYHQSWLWLVNYNLFTGSSGNDYDFMAEAVSPQRNKPFIPQPKVTHDNIHIHMSATYACYINLEMGWYINASPCRNMILVSIQLLMYQYIMYCNNWMYWLEQHDKHPYNFESTSQIIELTLQ